MSRLLRSKPMRRRSLSDVPGAAAIHVNEANSLASAASSEPAPACTTMTCACASSQTAANASMQRRRSAVSLSEIKTMLKAGTCLPSFGIASARCDAASADHREELDDVMSSRRVQSGDRCARMRGTLSLAGGHSVPNSDISHRAGDDHNGGTETAGSIVHERSGSVVRQGRISPLSDADGSELRDPAAI